MNWLNEIGQLSMRDPKAIAIVIAMWALIVAAIWLGKKQK